jgi:GAF domain-containing protein
VKLVVCCWNLASGTVHNEDLNKQMAADAVFASLEVCVDQVEAWIFRPTSAGETSPLLPDTEQAQIAALHDLGLAASSERLFDRDEVSGRIAQAFEVPIALISLIDEVHRRPGPDAVSETKGGVPKDSLEAHVVAANEVLVSEDVTKDARFADDPLVLEKGIRFYAGAPLRTSSGPVIGSVCLVDTRPRQFAEEDRERLQQMADGLMAQIEERAKELADHPQDLVPLNNPSKKPA